MEVVAAVVAVAEGAHPNAAHPGTPQRKSILRPQRLENLADQYVGPFGTMTDNFCHEENGKYAKK